MLQIRCKVKSFCRLSQIYDTYNVIYNLTILCDLQFDNLQFTIYWAIWRFGNFYLIYNLTILRFMICLVRKFVVHLCRLNKNMIEWKKWRR